MPAIGEFATAAFRRLPADLLGSIEASAMPSLGPGPEQPQLAELLSEREAVALGDVPSGRDRECLSGLWLLAGDLDRSHTISQSIDSPEGSFWHGIMHRREGDYGNAKYWFRRVGSHPVFDALAGSDSEHYPNPGAFVDACAAARTDAAERTLETLQWQEWQLLFLHCFHGRGGGQAV